MPDEDKSLILIASKSLSLQAVMGDMLASQAKVISLVREQQFDYWLESANNKPDLVLLDLNFMHGETLAFCTRWTQHPLARDIPVLILGEDNAENEVDALMAGASDYLRLPAQPMVYLARVKIHLEQIDKRKKLEALSMTDALTGIANRRYFDDFISAEWRRAVREDCSLGLIIADIDFFKLFNDHYGHLAGDKALKQVAQCLASAVQRPRDIVARFGGEEFVILLPSIDAQGVAIVAQRLVSMVRALEIEHQDSKVSENLTVSLGLAWGKPVAEMQVSQFIQTADEALYESKHRGRNQASLVKYIEQPVAVN